MTSRKRKHLLISTGDPSGDAYGAALVRELLAREPGLDVAGLGGPKMAAAGVRLLRDLTEHAVVGIMGLFSSAATFTRARRTITHILSTRPPDALILIDFPWFNLILAKHAKRVGVPVIYYVSPQVWAWHTSRIALMARIVRKMLVFFEFEREMYERTGLDVTHVGHPLLDTMAGVLNVTDRSAVRQSLGVLPGEALIGLLPGSRRKEVQYVLPVLLGAAEIVRRELGEVTFITGWADRLDPAQHERIASRFSVRPRLVAGRTYDVMLASDLLLVCSGTATLEAGLLGTPMVATYASDIVSYIIFGSLVVTPHLALANVAAGERVVPECYMINATPRRVAAAALDLWHGELDETRRKLGVIRAQLGRPGASARAAEEILRII